ncbi:PAS domain S-box protein [Zoogloea dura]|uniref:PAS domain S-box protein n=1 Tax=Zoogloea dura TaxID=2728840 RepID=UPI001F2D2B9A|nr:PAS domain S-box protein [Zoogloea dura]
MESSSTRDLALRRALIDHAFDQGRGGVLLNAVGVLGVTWFHSIVAGSHIDPRWLAAMLTITVFRMWTIWNAPRLREGRSVVFAERLYSLPMMLMAVLWFMLPWQLLPTADADEMLVLLMVQAGLASGAASMLAAFKWPARFYIACQLLSSVILLFGSHSHGLMLSLLGLAYLAIMLFSHSRARDSLVTAQTRLFDNLSLLDEARQQQKLVEDLNRDLVATRDAMRAQNLGLERLVAERTERIRLASVAIEHIAAGLMVTDAEGRVVEVNPAFSEITGYAAEQMLGQPASSSPTGTSRSSINSCGPLRGMPGDGTGRCGAAGPMAASSWSAARSTRCPERTAGSATMCS